MSWEERQLPLNAESFTSEFIHMAASSGYTPLKIRFHESGDGVFREANRNDVWDTSRMVRPGDQIILVPPERHGRYYTIFASPVTPEHGTNFIVVSDVTDKIRIYDENSGKIGLCDPSRELLVATFSGQVNQVFGVLKTHH